MNWNFFQFFQDENGDFSCTRLMTFIIPANILFNQTYLTVTTGTWINLDPISAGIIFGVLGLKYVQKKVEVNGNGKPEKKEA